MREIKFRAWDKYSKAMSPPFVLLGEFTLLGGIHAWQQESREDRFTSLELLSDLIIMQYTGQKDKNGVEIYEGDIVIVERVDDYCFGKDNYEERVVVGPPIYEELEAYCTGGVDGNDTVESILVIGNIYKNPELLT